MINIILQFSLYFFFNIISCFNQLLRVAISRFKKFIDESSLVVICVKFGVRTVVEHLESQRDGKGRRGTREGGGGGGCCGIVNQ